MSATDSLSSHSSFRSNSTSLPSYSFQYFFLVPSSISISQEKWKEFFFFSFFFLAGSSLLYYLPESQTTQVLRRLSGPKRNGSQVHLRRTAERERERQEKEAWRGGQVPGFNSGTNREINLIDLWRHKAEQLWQQKKKNGPTAWLAG